MFTEIKRNLSNVIGWNTSRKIIVIESDDWGSIRTFSEAAYVNLKKFGLDVGGYYNQFDCLESNQDLNELFKVLLTFKDANGNNAVFTPMCIMGNPDLNKIIESGFKEYYFEGLHETIKKYPDHNEVLELWRKGINLNIFRPGLHGREHINVLRFMQLVQNPKTGMEFSIRNGSIGASGFKGENFQNYLGALYPKSKEEVLSFHEHLVEAGSLFEKYCGYQPLCFIAPNREEPKELEATLKKIGVKYLTRSKNRYYPLGDGNHKKEFNWMGRVNEHGQLILVRNAHFEPIFLNEHFTGKNWIDSCLNDIEIAFRWKKPALISSHRVNFIGHINKSVREDSLSQLTDLLGRILKKWPDVEFMSSEQLGQTIEQSRLK